MAKKPDGYDKRRTVWGSQVIAPYWEHRREFVDRESEKEIQLFFLALSLDAIENYVFVAHQESDFWKKKGQNCSADYLTYVTIFM